MTAPRWSEAQFAEWQAKRPRAEKPRPDYIPIAKRRKRGMNRLETAYARELEAQKQSGAIQWWAFEPMRLRLADGTYYRPDFGVMRNGALQFFETKGFMREAARVRINIAADRFPFAFYLVRKDRSGWQVAGVARGSGDGIAVPHGPSNQTQEIDQ